MKSSSMRLPAVAALLAVMLFVPAAVDRSSLTSLFTQFAVISLLAMSYNMLMGQTGMLSFGHAVYSGLGAYCTAHFLNHFGADGLGAGIVFLPLVGAVSGAFFGLTLGFVSTRRSGIAFAMITLGISELIAHLALMMPGWSGGESGITVDRMLSTPVLGFDLGSGLQAYYYVLGWTVLVVLLQFLITRTPIGRLSNAVRDNAERVMFIGFNPQKIRLLTMVLSGAFAGIGGSLMVVNYEIVTSETLGLGQSGMLLIAAYLGGSGLFLGPVLGAIVYVLFMSFVATLTQAWLLYFGVLFILVVLYSPRGLMPLLLALPQYGPRQWLRLLAVALIGAAAVQLIETVYLVEDGQSGLSLLPLFPGLSPAMLSGLMAVLIAALCFLLHRKRIASAFQGGPV